MTRSYLARGPADTGEHPPLFVVTGLHDLTDDETARLPAALAVLRAVLATPDAAGVTAVVPTPGTETP